LMKTCRAYIDEHRPKAFIIENVSTLKQQHPDYYNEIMTGLKNIGPNAYTVRDEVLNTAEHGLPQNRSRLYIVGVKKHEGAGDHDEFEFPRPMVCMPLDMVLDMDNKKPSTVMPKTQTHKRNLAAALESMKAKGVNPKRSTVAVDISCGPGRRPHWKQNLSPCMTRARGGAGGYWITNLNRFTTTAEILMLQGIAMSKVKREHVSDRQLGLMARPITSRVYRALRLLSCAACTYPATTDSCSRDYYYRLLLPTPTTPAPTTATTDDHPATTPAPATTTTDSYYYYYYRLLLPTTANAA